MKKIVNKILGITLAATVGSAGLVGADIATTPELQPTPRVNQIETVERIGVSIKEGEGRLQAYRYVDEPENTLDKPELRVNKNRVVEYAYAGDREVRAEKDEIIEMRTPTTQTFTTNEAGKYKMRSYTTQVFADGGDGKWYELKYATTTVENFLEKTNERVRQETTLLGTPFAWADVTEDSGIAALAQPQNQQGATSTTWSTMVGESAGTSVFWGGNNAIAYSQYFNSGGGTDLFSINRVMFPFDTSPLPVNASTTALSLHVYLNVRYAASDGFDYVAIATSTNSHNPDNFATTDFGLCAAGNKVSVDYDIVNDLSSSAYNQFDINYDGQVHIDYNDFTFFCMRNGHDWDDDEPPIGTVSGVDMANQNTTNPPYIEITFTSANEEPVAGRQITPLASINNEHIFRFANTNDLPVGVVIDGSELVNGDPYLILFNMAIGNASSSIKPYARLFHGSDVLRYSAAEGSSSGFFSITNKGFFGIATTTGTGNAADDLYLALNCNDGSQGCAYDGVSLIAISLADLTQGKDYWYGASTATTTTSSTSVCSDFATVDVPTVSGHEYIVIASGAGYFASGSGTADGLYIAMSGDLTTTTNTEGQQEWEDDEDVMNYGYAELVTGDGTTQTASICGRKSQGAVNNGEFNYGSVFVARANAFSQATTSTSYDYATTTVEYNGVSSASFTDVLSIDYTPKSTERVIVIGSGRYTENTNFRSIITRLQNASSTGTFADVNNYDAADINHDIWASLMFGSEIIFKDDGYQQYKMQMSGEASTPSTTNRDARLLIWSMKLHRVRTGIEQQ